MRIERPLISRDSDEALWGSGSSITAVGERPVAPFVLSLIAGVVVLAGSWAVASFSPGSSYYGGMMGGYGYGWMMDGYYGMVRGFGGGVGWLYGFGAIGIASGIVILGGAMMLYSQPARASTLGAMILAFSIVSLLGMGGFFLGATLGVIGGALAMAWKPSR